MGGRRKFGGGPALRPYSRPSGQAHRRLPGRPAYGTPPPAKLPPTGRVRLPLDMGPPVSRWVGETRAEISGSVLRQKAPAVRQALSAYGTAIAV